MDLSAHALWIAFGLATTGFIAGIINTIAGGASALTIPALIFAGLPPTEANAVNRIPVVLQCITSTAGFARARQIDHREARPLIALFAIGAVPGALLATVIGDTAIEWVLALTMVGVAVFMVFAPSIRRAEALQVRALNLPRGLAVFAVGIFGGLIQAGVGLLMLTVLASLFHYDLTRANAIKVVAALVLATVSLLTFIARGFIELESLFYAAMLAVGTMSGAWVGVRLAITRGQKLIRYTAALMAIGAAIAVLIR